MSNTIISKLVSEVQITFNGHNHTVTSKQIAIHFQKKHSHVLREIERIRYMIPNDFYESNFGLINYSTNLGHAIRQDKAYALTRDAFSLLAMGFTGKAAITWKLKYIEAFNALEQELVNQFVNKLENLKTDREQLKVQCDIYSQKMVESSQLITSLLTLKAPQLDKLYKIKSYRERGLKLVEIAKLVNCDRSTVKVYIRKLKNMGLLPNQGDIYA